MNKEEEKKKILPPNALSKSCIGISVSESSDLPRLGLLEAHFRAALAEITRCVLISGGQIAYGGHLRADGYTAFLVNELQKYGRKDYPFQIFLAWQEHKKLSTSEIKKILDDLDLFARITFLDSEGNPVDPYKNRPDTSDPEQNSEVCKKSLTALRHYMVRHTQGRIFIGGKTKNFQGYMPGLIEETIISLESQQPIYLAGGFGGATAHIIKALGVDDGKWFPEETSSEQQDIEFQKGLGILSEIRKRKNWAGLKNGLTDDENRQLAAMHRPSGIATLISLGLGRLFQR